MRGGREGAGAGAGGDGDSGDGSGHAEHGRRRQSANVPLEARFFMKGMFFSSWVAMVGGSGRATSARDALRTGTFSWEVIRYEDGFDCRVAQRETGVRKGVRRVP